MDTAYIETNDIEYQNSAQDVLMPRIEKLRIPKSFHMMETKFQICDAALVKISDNHVRDSKSGNRFLIEDRSLDRPKLLTESVVYKPPSISKFVVRQELIKVMQKHKFQLGNSDIKENDVSVSFHSSEKFVEEITFKDEVSKNFNDLHDINEPLLVGNKQVETACDSPNSMTLEISVKSVKCNKYYHLVTDSINFNTLKEVLLLLFTHRMKDIGLCVLTPQEMGIFQAVLERKCFTMIEGVNFINLETLKQTNNLNLRRSEEKFKFIVKRIIKYLKKRDKIKTEEEFYFVYFSELSRKINVPLNHFYDPHNKILKNSYFKSLSTDYVMLLLRSDLFLVELLYYLDTLVIDDHIESLDSKVGNLCHKWELIHNTFDKSLKSAEFIRQMILNTEKGSKLPWSIGEVQESVDLMKNIIHNWNGQKYLR